MTTAQDEPPALPDREDDAPARVWIEAHRALTGYVDGQWLTDPVDPGVVVEATRAALHRERVDIAHCLHALSACIQDSAGLLAALDSLGSGQPIARSQQLSVPLAARYTQYYVGWALRPDEERIDWPNPGVVLLELPVAPVLLVDLIRHAVWALAEGSMLVISQPSGHYTALLFADLCAQADFPAGLVNVVVGNIAANHWHQPRRVVIMPESAPTVIVLDDADLQRTVEGAIEALWLNPDRTRRSAAKLFVSENNAERVMMAIRVRLATRQIGDPLDTASDISADQATGGPLPVETGPDGIVQVFQTLGEAITRINQLNANPVSVWTESIGAAVELTHRIKTGTIWVNALNLFDPALDSRSRPRLIESPSKVVPWLSPSGHPEQQQLNSLYINGQFVRSESGETRLIGGANHRLLAAISVGGKADIDKAVQSALAASEHWEAINGADRVGIMYRLADLMQQHKARLADSIAARSGVPGADADAVIELRIGQLIAATAMANNMARDQQRARYLPNQALALTVHDPVGVLGVIDPVSMLYEMTLVISKVLVNSATAVIIPSERYPLTALAFCELLTLAGFPPGVINVVPGDRETLTSALASYKQVTMWLPSGAQPLPVPMKTVWLPYGDGQALSSS